MSFRGVSQERSSDASILVLPAGIPFYSKSRGSLLRAQPPKVPSKLADTITSILGTPEKSLTCFCVCAAFLLDL